MVITYASLLFQIFYFVLDVTFLELTYIPIFCWILKDDDVPFISFHYYLVLLQNYVWILKLSCLARILSSWESLGKMLTVCVIYECICCFYSFFISFNLGSIAVLIFIVLTLHTSHALYLFYYLLHYFLLTPLKNHFRYCSKYEHSLIPNVLIRSLQLTIIRKLDCMILLDIQKGWSLKVSMLLLIFSTGNMLWSNKICSWFLLTNLTHLRCA